MKTDTKPENRSWPRENTTPAAATKNDRIMAGQNDTEGHRSVLMILSCHDSVCIPDLRESTRRDFEKEPAERTEIRKAKSFCPASIEICRPFICVMSSVGSALCSLCCLLFKAVWLRSALCALCVLLWQ